MYTRRNYPLKTMLSWTWKRIFLFVLSAVIPVILFDVFDWRWLTLPWLPLGLAGTALAFITGFKNNAAYDRAWEARKIYGTIINSSRKFALMVNDFITLEFVKEPVNDTGLFKIRRKLVDNHIAWLTCLRYNLRQERPWEAAQLTKEDIGFKQLYKVQEFMTPLEEALKPNLSRQDWDYVSNMPNHATACLKLQSNYLNEMRTKGYLDRFRHIEMENVIGELIDSQGQAERIKNFPYPRQFATLNLLLMKLFILLLPLGIMSEFDRIGNQIAVNEQSHIILQAIRTHFVWLAVPFSTAVSWVFYAMERTGDVTENPFVGLSNDVPITTISRSLEIEMLKLIGEEEAHIPEPIAPAFDTQM